MVTNQCLKFGVPKVLVSHQIVSKMASISSVKNLLLNISLSNLMNFRHFLL